jgi:hypothetical protein
VTCGGDQRNADEAQDPVSSSEAAEVSFPLSHNEFRVGYQRHRRAGGVAGNEWVGVAMPPPHRRLDVAKPEAPVTPEQAGVVNKGLEATLGDENDVVDHGWRWGGYGPTPKDYQHFERRDQ